MKNFVLQTAASEHYTQHEKSLRTKPYIGTMHKANVYTDLGILGEDRIVEVWYTYTPEERATRDEPGCPEEWEILAVYADFDGVLVDIMSAVHDMDALTEHLKTSHHGNICRLNKPLRGLNLTNEGYL